MGNWKKVKYGLFLTAIVFIVGGLWFPILCGAGEFNIRNVLVMGIAAVVVMWGGGTTTYLLMRSEEKTS